MRKFIFAHNANTTQDQITLLGSQRRVVIFYFIFKKFIYFERERVHMWEGWRERERERLPSRLPTDYGVQCRARSHDPRSGPDPKSRVGPLTD